MPASQQQLPLPGLPIETPQEPSRTVESSAFIDPSGLYRYWLKRRWGGGSLLPFVMLNPSTADHWKDDPTIRLCMALARREQYGGIHVVNLYAYRATDPKALLTCADPVGPANDNNIASALRGAWAVSLPVVAAWGANAKPDRVGQVLNLVPDVNWRCLGTNKGGSPKHPLFLPADTALVPFPTSADEGAERA
jgi:hypothetical protein